MKHKLNTKLNLPFFGIVLVVVAAWSFATATSIGCRNDDFLCGVGGYISGYVLLVIAIVYSLVTAIIAWLSARRVLPLGKWYIWLVGYLLVSVVLILSALAFDRHQSCVRDGRFFSYDVLTNC